MFVAKFLQTKKKSRGGVQTKKKSGGGVQNEKKCVPGVQKSKIVKRATQDSVKKNWLNFGGDRFGQNWPIPVHKKLKTDTCVSLLMRIKR